MDFEKENINMVNAQKAKKTVIATVVMPWNGLILGFMPTQLHT